MLSRELGDVHERAAAQIEQRGGAAAVGGNFEMVRAAEERTDFTRSDVGVGRDDLRDRMISNADLESVTRQRIEGSTIDVGDQIAEAVDAQHLTDDGAGIDFGPWNL